MDLVLDHARYKHRASSDKYNKTLKRAHLSLKINSVIVLFFSLC